MQDKHFPAVFTDTNETQKHTLTHSLAITHGGKITVFLNTQCSETESFLHLRLNKLRVFTKPTFWKSLLKLTHSKVQAKQILHLHGCGSLSKVYTAPHPMRPGIGSTTVTILTVFGVSFSF